MRQQNVTCASRNILTCKKQPSGQIRKLQENETMSVTHRTPYIQGLEIFPYSLKVNFRELANMNRNMHA